MCHRQKGIVSVYYTIIIITSPPPSVATQWWNSSPTCEGESASDSLEMAQ